MASYNLLINFKIMEIILKLFINTIAVLIASFILPGIKVDGFWWALIVALVLGIINIFLKPILVLLTLPINIITLGLFTFVINALLVLLVQKLIGGFHVQGFWWAMLFSLVLSVIKMILDKILLK